MANAVASIPAKRLAGVSLIVFAALLTACGGSSASDKIHAPMVRAFSPYMSPINFNTLQQTPTQTDGMLSVSTDANYQGKIVVYFNEGTELDPASVFVGGQPTLGVDLSALQILQFQPGTGNTKLDLTSVEVLVDRIIVTPKTLPLANGQYSIGVLENIRNVKGKRLYPAPVFHSFTVGTDDVRPFVVTTDPANNEIGVGAGAPPPTTSSENVADVRTNIFGPTSPDVRIQFNEGITASTITFSNIQVVNAGATATGTPPTISPAPNFPVLKSVSDGATLPSNGHEVIWRPDPLQGGFPFGTIIEVLVVGWYDTVANEEADSNHTAPDNPSPVTDLSGNQMLISHKFQFQTLAPPDLPQNPFPEYAIWWAATDRVGTIDVVNQQDNAFNYLTQVGLANYTFPDGISRNVIPEYTDTVCTAQNIPGFEPTEISIDTRVHGGTCHTWVYCMSPNSGQIVIVNSRTSIPVALVDTPQPGGLSNQTGGAQAANVLMVTNSSANTLTTFDMSNVTPGTTYISGPIYVSNVQPTGNTPRAVSISAPATGSWNRDMFQAGPAVPVVMYADFTDGVVNTTVLNEEGPITSINLGPNSSPNDINMSPCVSGGALFLAAISQGGLPGEGKVAYYISGPGCQTGVASGVQADSLVGSLTGFDGPAGLDDVLSQGGNIAWWALCESGSSSVVTLGLETGAFTQPRIIATIEQVGANPVSVAHRNSWLNYWCISLLPWQTLFPCATQPTCFYNNTAQYAVPGCPSYIPPGHWDCTFATAQDLYICARGASQISVVNVLTGARDFYSPISIPGVRFVASGGTQ